MHDRPGAKKLTLFDPGQDSTQDHPEQRKASTRTGQLDPLARVFRPEGSIVHPAQGAPPPSLPIVGFALPRRPPLSPRAQGQPDRKLETLRLVLFPPRGRRGPIDRERQGQELPQRSRPDFCGQLGRQFQVRDQVYEKGMEGRLATGQRGQVDRVRYHRRFPARNQDGER